MREAGGQGGGRLNMIPTIIGKQDADDDADDDADEDKHTNIFLQSLHSQDGRLNKFLSHKNENMCFDHCANCSIG